LLAAACLAPVLTTGCATRTYRVYDPYYNDYHRWDDHENVYYHQWIVENRREDRDFPPDWTMIGRRNIGLGVTIITMTMTTIMIGITTGH